MSREIICTVGTSLLTNRDNRPWSGWDPRKQDPLPDQKQVLRWLRRAGPAVASAETNTLKALEIEDHDALWLLHSETKEGKFCAEVLRQFYDNRRRSVDLKPIGKLGYGAAEFTAGLKALVDVALTLARTAQDNKRQPVFCATGGFKAEIAFLNLLGALLGVEVVYLHELHRELVRLPRLPLSWDRAFADRHRDFFEWIDEQPRRSADVESWLAQRPELRPLVEDGDDGCTYLTAAGDLLFKAADQGLVARPRAYWPKPSSLPPKQKNNLSSVGHHRPKGLARFVERLCAVDCVTRVSFLSPQAKGNHVTVQDPQNGVFVVSYRAGNSGVSLRVETTARGEAQCELVAEYLRKLK